MKVVNGGLAREKKEGLGGAVAVCGGGWREREYWLKRFFKVWEKLKCVNDWGESGFALWVDGANKWNEEV